MKKEKSIAVKEKKAVGRPSKWAPELAALICDRLATGESLRTICKTEGVPDLKNILEWVDDDREGFRKQYARARQAQAAHLFDDLLEIADSSVDDVNVQSNRLRVDTRKWYLSKVLPKVFGDKLDITSDGKELPAPILGVILPNKLQVPDQPKQLT